MGRARPPTLRCLGHSTAERLTMTDELARLICGDCREIMPAFEAESFDACVTDPPYDLTNRVPDVPKCVECGRVLGGRDGSPEKCPRCGGELQRQRRAASAAGGFMGKTWDGTGVAFRPETWTAVLRVLKPGAHLLAFGGTRTHHRLMCAIEDAGFEIRDCLMWLSGQGFPKSLDVSKAIDKAAGAKREVVGERVVTGTAAKDGRQGRASVSAEWETSEGLSRTLDVTAPATAAARQWDGWGTALKPAWEIIILARKPLTGTVAANVQEHGTGALNVRGCRIGNTPTMRTTTGARSGVALNAANDGSLSNAGLTGSGSGRWPANVVLSHTPDCRQVGTRKVRPVSGSGVNQKREGESLFGLAGSAHSGVYTDPDGTETVAAWDCAPDCPVRMLDGQSGERPPPWGECTRQNPAEGFLAGNMRDGAAYRDTGGASRFFYTAKASRREREYGLESMEPRRRTDGREKDIENPRLRTSPALNDHPTVKPLALMRWLVRLVTPPGGKVLDPFMGSGSTKLACEAERFGFVGIDSDEHYCEIARHRKLLPEVEAEAAQTRMPLT